ncbi:MAG: peptidylprolyl isomerase [Cyanomargarita calcarea GSE-NOS-MK-12-04C]|jgi:parvulin-like peptidyl-prolyl isomerase|uniref:peptidylprolyl isomerase n=1 Tax=Cyanomargarita calcarea GSE-NOS-MK-12-04C TaxID=2839659 RepID=A0A951QW00_9CYAN|nr:peptidylprolyl isomerase [Cyanomargarita calcarea GSE-NOS-MK-12-04C]
MYPVLQVGDRKLTGAEVLPLLGEYQLLPLLVKEMIIDKAIAKIECTSEEVQLACEQLAQQYAGMSSEQLEVGATRQLKLEKFKQATWGGDLESYFSQRKAQLDRVVYSLITVKDIAIAQELYFRIQEGEQSFAKLAWEHSQGPEAETDGLIGPVELQTIHPALARILSAIQPNQLLPPTQVGEWFVIVRLQKMLPAKFDRSIRQRLLNERFNNWLQGEVAAQKCQIQHEELGGVELEVGS